ncbi:TraB/GumN family protein, partial [Paeniclostridium sordellii]|uniref:TraB/GumN family protein n=1 Tax=Paraclostridium sordellii TaxID=1505 RepID=UPI0021098F96
LVGTLHPGKSNVNYNNRILNKLMNKTDALAVEIDVTNENNIKKLDKDEKEKMYLKDGEIKDVLSNKEKIKFEKILKELDSNYDDIKNLTPTGFLS